MQEMDLLLDYPAKLAARLQSGEIDLALLPVAAIPTIPGARIVSDYGIAADGNVASVCIFSQEPLEACTEIYLDYQSRSSVRLCTLLLEQYWKIDLKLIPAPVDYIEQIQGNRAGVIIGDRALIQRRHFKYCYDLATAWKSWSGLPFVFAAWVANKALPADFLDRFEVANKEGLDHIDEIVAAHPFPEYDLQTYYRENIHYFLDKEKRKGLDLFLKCITQP